MVVMVAMWWWPAAVLLVVVSNHRLVRMRVVVTADRDCDRRCLCRTHYYR